MGRKIFFSDIVDGIGKGIRSAFNHITGNARLKKRGIDGNNEVLGIAAFCGSSAGVALGGVAAIMTIEYSDPSYYAATVINAAEVWQMGLAVFGGTAIGVPLAVNHTYTLYKASDHDRQKSLAAGPAQPALPAPKPMLT